MTTPTVAPMRIKDRIYGWVRDTPDFRDFKASRPINVASLPPRVDLRDRMPPVYDQGQTGSCTGNASCAAVDYNEGREGRPFIGPSRLFAYYNARAMEGTESTDAGAQVRDVIKALSTLGVCTEADWAYDEARYAVRPPDACYASARKNLVSSYTSVGEPQGPSVDQLRYTLARGEPVVFGMSVYDSFEGDAIANSGVMTMPAATETMVGGHCILLVGYDDKSRMFIVRNSWGADWGDGGHFYSPYAFVASAVFCSDFWTIQSVL